MMTNDIRQVVTNITVMQARPEIIIQMKGAGVSDVLIQYEEFMKNMMGDSRKKNDGRQDQCASTYGEMLEQTDHRPPKL